MKHITITGSLGSGKSAVSKILRDTLGYDIESIGTIQRKMAQEYGMSIIEFNKYMETHPEFDNKIDEYVARLGESEQPRIFDSRLAWHFVRRSLKVYLYVDDRVAAERVYKDSVRVSEQYDDIDTAQAQIRTRRESEVLRYKTLYNVDLEDMSNYDIVIDTSHITPQEVADRILAAYGA